MVGNAAFKAINLTSLINENKKVLQLLKSLEMTSCTQPPVQLKSISKRQLFAEMKECSRLKNLEKGMSLHAAAIQNGDDSDIYVASNLVSMYAKCGSLFHARTVFDKMQHRDVVVWNALIFGYADNGEGLLALEMFSQMQCQGCAPTDLTYIAAVKACACLAEKGGVDVALNRGVVIHSLVVGSSDIRLVNTLIDMYSKCRSMIDAHRTFDMMPERTAVSWNSLIFGYVENGEGKMALDLLIRMRLEGYAPTSLTFVAILKVCANLEMNAEEGMTLHFHAMHCRCDSDIFVANTLIDMYGKYGFMEDARKTFDGMRRHDVVSWSVLILGYAENGREETALGLFSHMKQCCQPDALACVAALQACSGLATKEKGKIVNERLMKVKSMDEGIAIHCYAESSGLDRDIRVANTLIDMYAKCGSMPEARKVFNNIRNSSVVSWNAMIFGYADNGEGNLALDFFFLMKYQGSVPDVASFIAAFKACGIMGALDVGKALYQEACHRGLDKDRTLMTSLVDFYGKCGSMRDAQQAFDTFTTKDSIIWTALMAGYSRQGDVTRVFELLEEMQRNNLEINSITVLCVLAVCSHAGLVEKGSEFFESMTSNYGIIPNIEHYACMVDMLCRANQLNEAMSLVWSMPFEPDSATIWTSILRLCWKMKRVDLGRLAFEHLLGFNDKDSRAYVLMSSIYSNAQMLDKQLEIDNMKIGAGLQNACIED